jgi:putative intracellular protease/amidase
VDPVAPLRVFRLGLYGAFVLAAADPLKGRHATTHWQHARLPAAAYPNVWVQPDAIYVENGTFLTSAGVSAGHRPAAGDGGARRPAGGQLDRPVSRLDLTAPANTGCSPS